ncbi:hypothetical protein MTO96_043225 [Rhipicephalus appendiculatus]
MFTQTTYDLAVYRRSRHLIIGRRNPMTSQTQPDGLQKRMDACAGDLPSAPVPDVVQGNSSQQHGPTSPIQSQLEEAGTAFSQGPLPPSVALQQ